MKLYFTFIKHIFVMRSLEICQVKTDLLPVINQV